ncbi:hypothetical protein [Acidovorax sp. SUPP2825]|uniref:hypothetical protein n=1 Tax=Acidovorax sp. SUPP2825 TaxID=2920879 RepID=UPI0024E18629|nr:hypothetical protein [Acidovorax sp. SUPP2825]
MDHPNITGRSIRSTPHRTDANTTAASHTTERPRTQTLEHQDLSPRTAPGTAEPATPMRRTALPERSTNSPPASGSYVAIDMPTPNEGLANAGASRSWMETMQSGGRRMAQGLGAAWTGAHALAGQVGWRGQAPQPAAAQATDVQAPVQDIVIDMVDLEAGIPDVAVDPPAADRPALSAGARLVAALDNMPFLMDNSQEQRDMAAQYSEWARQKADAREAAGAEGYSLRAGDAALPAGYDFARQLLNSMARSPATNAMATAIGPRSGLNAEGQSVNIGELSNQYDSALAGGTLGGLTAHMVDTTLLSAMDRRAAMANFPQFKAIDPHVLVPDPCPVQIRVVNGQKEFWRPVTADSLGGSPHLPTMNELKAQADLRRKSVTTLQAALDGKQWGVLAQPLMTAGFNVLRRQVMPIYAFTNPALVFAHSLWASGLGGGVTKLALGMGKSVAYANLDDFAGGTQKANVFAKSLPQPGLPAAGLADIKGLPGYGAEVAKETLALTQHFWIGPWRTSGSWLPNGDDVRARVSDMGRSLASNVMAGVASTGIGALVGQLGRGGSNSALPGESLRSQGYMLQQAGQSSSNDFVWQASKEYLGGASHSLNDSLDKWRSNKLVRLSNAAYIVQGKLATRGSALQGAIPEYRGDEALYLSTAMDKLASLRDAREPKLADLEFVQRLLLSGATGAGEHREEIAEIQEMVDQTIRTLRHRDELTDWVKPKSD